MPSFTFLSPALTLGVAYNPLIGWQYEYLPFPAAVKLVVNSPQTTPATDRVTLSITSGSEQIMEASPVQSTAVANLGVLPAELNTPAHTWLSPAGDRLKLLFTMIAGTTDYVQGTIYVNPLRRR